MEFKTAHFPDHSHNHRHSGKKDFSVSVKEPYTTTHCDHNKKYDLYCLKSSYNSYSHSVTVDYSYMSESEASVTDINGAGIELTRGDNDLYPPHMRVYFIFKCL